MAVIDVKNVGPFCRMVVHILITLEISFFVPSNNENRHVNIALSLNRMDTILIDQRRYREALEYYIHALQIRENIFPNGQLSITVSLSKIGYIHYIQENYTLPLNYLEKVLKMRETLFADTNHATLVSILIFFGLIYIKLRNSNNALTYHMRILKFSKIVFLFGHLTISECLINIGITYCEIEDYTKTLEYFEKVLENEKQNFAKPNLIQLARNYDNMGICLCYQSDYETVKIIQQVHHRIQHTKFVDAVGDILLTMEANDDALKCFFISLNIK
jgi:tetratricopeptide (TPR) repeat protein